LQAFSHTLRRLIFTDKRIGAIGEWGILTGVQMADEDYDQRSRAGHSELFKNRTGCAGEQAPIHQKHVCAAAWCLS